MRSMEKINLKVYVNGKEKTFSVEKGTTALDALEKNGITVYAPCGGAGHCGGCRAEITGEARFSERESALLGCEENENVHLLCSTELLGDATIVLATDGAEIEKDGIRGEYEISRSERGFGLAVDIGTTTVAVYICDLSSGEIVFDDAFLNPQSRFGADVITRIAAIKADESLLEKQKSLLFDAINSSIGRFSGDKNDISRAVICGNTVMEHIAAGLDPRGLAEFPFEGKSLFGCEYGAEQLGIDISRGASVYFAPCIASYVGGDISCGAAVSGADVFDGDVLYLDIGTNGEIMLKHDGRLFFCSAAAGPALEGAGITCGIPSVEGAVREVKIENDILLYKTIKNKAAKGICGSGVIDATAALIDVGAIDETGRITDEERRYLKTVNGKKALVIDEENGIYFTENDVRAVQLAKAAIAAGIRLLAERSGADIGKIDKFIIAGGFGSHINIESAVKIGLFPKSVEKKAVFAGNAAGTGAAAVLLSDEMKRRAEKVCGGEYIELSTDGKFSELFFDEMGFDV